ncbi:unnamed protein product, partial [Staurois parvus]
RGRAPQAERRGSGSNWRSGGRLDPPLERSNRSRAPRRSGGAADRTPRHDSGLRPQTGIGSPGIKSFGSTAGTASSGKAVGSESTGMTAGTGSDIGSSGWTAGIGSPGIRSFGSTAGTASSGKAVGSESTGNDRGHWVRHWIV